MSDEGLVVEIREVLRTSEFFGEGMPGESGRIRTDTPNELRGTDAIRYHTKNDAWCWFSTGSLFLDKWAT